MTYTIEQLDEAIGDGKWSNADREGDEYYEEGGWGDLTEAIYVWRSRKDEPAPSVTIPGIGVVTQVEQFGGEGQGDDYWIVVRIVSEDGSERFFKRCGWYASYNGGYYEGPTLAVKPAEKTIIVWDEV